jgi:hypothetical protein
MIAGTVAGGAMQFAGSQQAAAGHRLAAQERSASAQFEQQQLEVQAQTARTAADQAEARRREELTSNLETIQAIRAGRGVGASPTGEAVMTSAIEDQEREINIERLNFLTKADLSQRASVLAGRKAKTSLLAGELQARSDTLSGYAGLANTATKAASIYRYG